MADSRSQRTDPKTDDKVFVILGWVFTALTLFAMPMLFGPAAIVMGVMAYLRGARTNGILILAVAALFIILYLVLGVLLSSFFLSHPELSPFHVS